MDVPADILCESNNDLEILSIGWNISNLSFLPNDKGYFLHSTKFTGKKSQTTWHLSFAPNGFLDSEDGYAAIKLGFNCPEPTYAKYDITILNTDCDFEYTKGKTDMVLFEAVGMHAYSEFIDRESLKREYIRGDKICIVCNICIRLPLKSYEFGTTTFCIPDCSLRQNLGALLQNQKFADVTVQFADGEIRAHKAILAARSKTLAAQFELDSPSGDNCLDLKDFSVEVGKILLDFIYTNKLEYNEELMCELCKCASKVEVSNLLETCLELIQRNLHLKNCIKYMLLSLEQNLTDLKKIAQEVITGNLTYLIESAEWLSLAEKHPELLVEIYKNLAKSKSLGIKYQA